MKITKTKLKQIIKEEVTKLLTENEDQENEYKQYALTILDRLSGNDPGYFAQALSFYTQLKEDIEVNAPTENDQILEKLKVIDQFAESKIQDVDFLSGLSELNITEKIVLRWCSSLQNVDGLQGLTSLTTLDLSDCESLQNVDGIKECTSLTRLYLSFCKSLQNVDGLQGLTSLTSLSLAGCYSLQNVDGLQGLTSLTSLSLWLCRSLPIKLQQLFKTDSSGTAYEKFMEALNASKRSQP
jgi:Leucine-rich repeat (LRR) protein